MNRKCGLLVLALGALALGACQKEENPVRTSNGGTPDAAVGVTTSKIAAQSQVTPAQPDRDSPPAPTPATHAGPPEVAAAGAAPTARDSPAQRPSGDSTPAQEANSMPKPGQVNNYMTPATDGDVKGSQQSTGTPKLEPTESGPKPATSASDTPKDAAAAPK